MLWSAETFSKSSMLMRVNFIYLLHTSLNLRYGLPVSHLHWASFMIWSPNLPAFFAHVQPKRSRRFVKIVWMLCILVLLSTLLLLILSCHLIWRMRLRQRRQKLFRHRSWHVWAVQKMCNSGKNRLLDFGDAIKDVHVFYDTLLPHTQSHKTHQLFHQFSYRLMAFLKGSAYLSLFLVSLG